MIDWVQLIQITNELPLKNDIPRVLLVITWTKSTTPSPIIKWVGVASKASIYMGIISTIWLMLNLSVRVPRPCLYMLGSPSKNLSIRVCKTVLHPLYESVELKTPDHHVMPQNTIHKTVHT